MRRVLLGAAVVVAACGGSGTQQARATQQVTVPLLTQTDVVRAYDRVRHAGLRVAIRNSFSARSLFAPRVLRQSPRFGTRVPAGSVVTITTAAGFIASATVPRPMPTGVVPRFAGSLASDVVTWAERRSLYWDIRKAPPLAPSSAPHLFGNFRVVRQRPAPGSTLRLGVSVQIGGRRGFRPTPITVWVERR